MNGIAAKVTNHPVKSASSPFVSGRLFRTELNQSPESQTTANTVRANITLEMSLCSAQDSDIGFRVLLLGLH